MEWKKIIKEELRPHEVMAGEVLELFEKYKRKYPEGVAYALAMAEFLLDHKLPPVVYADFLDEESLLKALGGRIKPAEGSPYKELLAAHMYRCAAEYARETEFAALLVTKSGAYILYPD